MDSGDMHAPLSYYVYCSLYAWADCVPSPVCTSLMRYSCALSNLTNDCVFSVIVSKGQQKMKSSSQKINAGVLVWTYTSSLAVIQGRRKVWKFWGWGKYNVVVIICPHPLVEIGLTDLSKFLVAMASPRDDTTVLSTDPSIL